MSPTKSEQVLLIMHQLVSGRCCVTTIDKLTAHVLARCVAASIVKSHPVSMLQDPKLWKQLHPFLPPGMRQAFESMMNNPEHRAQLQERIKQQVS